jgi:NADPH:quinone reductase-like Zn-dependent oxidoreductase
MASSINAADSIFLNGETFLVRMMAGGQKQPKHSILGGDIAGRVEAVGAEVTQFRPGDEVYADLAESGRGGFAEYVAVPENVLALKPAGLTFEQAAAVPMAAVTALQGLRDVAHLQSGQKVLINGASGGVGSFAVQLAKSFGADVTATCSTGKMDMVRSIGADRVVDYKQEDFTRNGQRYDLIFDVAAHRSLLDYRPALAATGMYVLAGGGMNRIMAGMLLSPLISIVGSKKFRSLGAKPDAKDLVALNGLLETGKVVPVIDRCYPLGQVADAFRYFGEGRAKGKIVISMAQNGA